MNWNGQRQTLDHLISLLQFPERKQSLQTDFNAKRRARVTAALTTRPLFIPLQYTMTAAAQVSPYRSTTPSLSYPAIITGIKADTQTRSIVIRRTEDEKPIVYVGEELNLFLRLDEVAGQGATNGGGQLGVFYFPEPIILPAGNRLTIEMYKTDVTADVEVANIVLVGMRVLNPAYAAELLDPAEKQFIESTLQMREIPRTIFLKQAITFDSAVAGGLATDLYTPEVEEPLLLRGIRTTLRQSTISLRVQGEPDWTIGQVPIWGLAAEDELVHDNYQWFSKPVFLHSKNQIEISRVVNSIDGSLIDAQEGNSITWIAQTV